MQWWKKFWRGRTASPDERLRLVRLTLPGWNDEGLRGDLRGWRDGQGDFLSLALTDKPLGLLDLSNEVALRDCFRRLAENRGGGLIEAHALTGALGPAASLIYKRLKKPAYTFTGMLLVPGARPSQVWTVVTTEHGTTGVREATIAAELLNAGSMTIEDYERAWAKDPYDSGYHAVDRSVLRFVSDDESYDERFPEHPLSKVRRILDALPGSVHLGPAGRGAASS